MDVLGRDDDFWELGGDSLGAVELVELLGQSVGERLRSTAIIECPTPPDSLRGWAIRPRSTGDLVWLTRGDATPLVVAPGAGDTALRFRRLAAELGRRATGRRRRARREPAPPASIAQRLRGSRADGTTDRHVPPIANRAGRAAPTAATSCTSAHDDWRRGRHPRRSTLLDLRADGSRTSKVAAHLEARKEQPARRRVASGIAGAVRRARRTARIPLELALAGRDRPGTVRHHDRLAVVAARASARYRPDPYGGRVVLVRSTQRAPEADPSMGWRTFAPNTEVSRRRAVTTCYRCDQRSPTSFDRTRRSPRPDEALSSKYGLGRGPELDP